MYNPGLGGCPGLGDANESKTLVRARMTINTPLGRVPKGSLHIDQHGHRRTTSGTRRGRFTRPCVKPCSRRRKQLGSSPSTGSRPTITTTRPDPSCWCSPMVRTGPNPPSTRGLDGIVCRMSPCRSCRRSSRRTTAKVARSSVPWRPSCSREARSRHTPMCTRRSGAGIGSTCRSRPITGSGSPSTVARTSWTSGRALRSQQPETAQRREQGHGRKDHVHLRLHPARPPWHTRRGDRAPWRARCGRPLRARVPSLRLCAASGRLPRMRQHSRSRPEGAPGRDKPVPYGAALRCRLGRRVTCPQALRSAVSRCFS